MKSLFAVYMVLLLPFALVPQVAHGAAFAKQSLFLSQATVNEGDTVFIYAVVANDQQGYFAGDVSFVDETGIAIGKVAIALEFGKASTVSVSWKPSTGQHTITADLVGTDGTNVESQESIFFINPKPIPASVKDPLQATKRPPTSPSLQATTTVADSIPLEKAVASFSPSLAIHTVPIFNAIDAGRTLATKRLDDGGAWSKEQITTAAQTKNGGFVNTAKLMLATVALYLSTALAYGFAHLGVFYPAFVLVLVYVLWKTYNMARRR